MKKLLSLFTISLFLITFQAHASRPAEDDPTPYVKPQATDSTIESSSNIPAPEMDETTSNTMSTESDSGTTNIETTQTGDIIQLQQTPAETKVMIIDFPIRGMDMTKVFNELGEPTKRFPAIGKPPITRWVYPDRTVFFEYSHVIHVVAK